MDKRRDVFEFDRNKSGSEKGTAHEQNPSRKGEAQDRESGVRRGRGRGKDRTNSDTSTCLLQKKTKKKSIQIEI